MTHKLITTALILYAPVTHAWFVPDEPITPVELEQAWIKESEAALTSHLENMAATQAEEATPPIVQETTPALVEQTPTEQQAAIDQAPVKQDPADLVPVAEKKAAPEHSPPKIESAVKAVLDWHDDFFEQKSEPLVDTSEYTMPKQEMSIPQSQPILTHQVSKKNIPLTKEEIANEKYSQAIEALKARNFSFAEYLLGMILKERPTHTLSRVQLAKLFILKNEYIQAEGLLTPIENFYLRNPEYIQTLALIYEHNGKKQEALSLLSQMPTQNRNTPEYYSLSASLYQQTGDYAMAKKYYQSLLSGDPYNTRWMLGFSVTLDSNGETGPAKTWYSKLLRTGNLDPAISTFVKNRLVVLGNTVNSGKK